MRTTLFEVPLYHAHKFKLLTTILSLTNYCYLLGSFQTTAKLSRVGDAHPDFLRPARLLPPVSAPLDNDIPVPLSSKFAKVKNANWATEYFNVQHRARCYDNEGIGRVGCFVCSISFF